MLRFELPVFPIMLVLSVLVHGSAFVFLGAEADTPPQLVPPQPGVASIRLVASVHSRPQPTEKPTDLLAELPVLDQPINPSPLADPALAKPTQRPVERPRELDPTPLLTSETKIATPTEIPDLLADVQPRLTTTSPRAKATAPSQRPVERPRVLTEPMPMLKADHRMTTPVAVPDLLADLSATVMPIKDIKAKHDPSKPISMPRPKTQAIELPKLEAITKVADLPSRASPGSQESAGAVDDLPQKLAINPPPPYPADALSARQEGTVTLRVTISVEGRVSAISIYSSSGVKSLDDSALTTVRRWVFVPARRGTRAVPFEVLLPIEFSIRRQF